MIKENMDNLKCANCKCFSKNKNAKDGTCQKWKARCGGQRVNSEDFCSDFEKKIDKDWLMNITKTWITLTKLRKHSNIIVQTTTIYSKDVKGSEIFSLVLFPVNKIIFLLP